MNRRQFFVLGAIGSALFGVAEIIRRQPLHFGVTPEEAAMMLPGDDLVKDANYIRTSGISMEARPEDLYPWLAQMGYHRGGLYSFDFLDRLFRMQDRPSSRVLIPEFQHLEVGDSIPVGRSGAFRVRYVEPKKALVLSPADTTMAITWQMVIIPVDDGKIRFISRNRAHLPRNPMALLNIAFWDMASFIMVRRWLQVLKGRAERLATQRRSEWEETLAGAEDLTIEAPLTEEAVVG